MNELVVIVEGETEQTFVRDQLAAHLALHGTSVWPVVSGRRRNQRGVQRWGVARQDMIRTLREGRYCSTMFDYYALPADWPGRLESENLPWRERASHVEKHLKQDISEAMGGRFHPARFIPYIQLHEFEALVFADVAELAAQTVALTSETLESLTDRFQGILDENGHPEAINDGYETCPSRRIAAIAPRYSKPLHGPRVTARIGLQVLRERCEHFGAWLQSLECIGTDSGQ